MRPGRINAYSMIDAQVSYRIRPANIAVKLGANNLFNKRVYQAYGSPAIGAVYYLSLVFDQLISR
jgi:iron complex outermembrane recepter protein